MTFLYSKLAAPALGLALAALSSSVWAQASPAEGPKPTEDARYRYDKDVYARLVVTLRYGDPIDATTARAPINLTEDCPDKGIFSRGDKLGETLASLLRADRTYSLGYSVTDPSGKVVEFTPVEITIRDRPWGPSKCIIHIEQLDYTSPIFDSFANSARYFRVEPVAYIREKPTTDFVKLSRDTATQLVKLVGAPAPVADAVGNGVRSTLEGAGSNMTMAYAVYLQIQPRPDSITEPSWTMGVALKSGAKPILIKAYLENVASLIATDRKHLDSNLTNSAAYGSILSAPFLGSDVNGGALRRLDQLIDFSAKDTEDIRNFNAKTNASDANASCRNIYRLLGSQGLTETDRSILLWAFARSQPNIGGETVKDKNLDQTSCIQDRKLVLNAVGVTLRNNTPSVDEQKGEAYNPSTPQMRQNIELDNAYVRFFNRSNTLQWANYARRLFVDKPLALDGQKTILATERVDLATNTDWRYYTKSGSEPMFKEVGCLAYFPSSVQAPIKANPEGPVSYMWAIGQTSTGAEVAIKATFAPVKSNDPAKISKLEMSNTIDADTRDAILAARKRAPCGDEDDWKPGLLFGES